VFRNDDLRCAGGRTHVENKSLVRKTPDLVDVHVGSRMKLRRMLVGMSQEALGRSLGLTFQQIQKYEKGTNRIGASRLYRIAQLLDVPVQFFFEDMPPLEGGEAVTTGFAEGDDTPYVVDFLNTPEGVALVSAFVRIPDPAVRRRIVEMVRSVSDAMSETPDGGLKGK